MIIIIITIINNNRDNNPTIIRNKLSENAFSNDFNNISHPSDCFIIILLFRINTVCDVGLEYYGYEKYDKTVIKCRKLGKKKAINLSRS